MEQRKTRTKQEILFEMRQLHGILKENPFRSSFSGWDYYRPFLYEMTDIWLDLAYRCSDTTEEESEQLKKFTAVWIHNFRQAMGYSNDELPSWKLYLIPYFDTMLQVTHRYLDKGELKFAYNAEYIMKKDPKNPGMEIRDRAPDGSPFYEVVKYEWLTKEETGLEDAELPGYFPIKKVKKEKLIEKLDRYIENVKQYLPDEEVKSLKMHFEKTTIPVSMWINKNRKG